MNFLSIQNKLITSPAARFKETQRNDIKDWINDRYAEVWGLEQWTFRDATALVTVTSASAGVTALPADLGIVTGLWRDDGVALQYREPRQFFDAYYGDTNQATPAEYTVVNAAISVGPVPNTGSAAYQIAYEKKLTLLVGDTDVPAIPVEYHQMLVHGAIATGSVMMNDFTYQFAEQRWQNAIAGMRRTYLASQRDGGTQWGADPLDDLYERSNSWSF